MTNLQPILDGEGILLRPLRPDDYDALFAAASDPLIWALHPAHDRYQEPVFRRFFDKALACGGALVVVDRASGGVIGTTRFYFEHVQDPGEVELGYTFLARAHWGGATNRELKRLMLAHAFTFAHTALFSVGEGNLRSRRALEKIGGRLTERRFADEVNGQPVVHLVYAITADDFARSPLAEPRA
ncbi:MAG TPA: GNAT family N-acetyltransferase [Sphingomonadaceae bacterium]|nr:GNAT family N-acetyltransferase [Sphingomonadaceae bacterium]